MRNGCVLHNQFQRVIDQGGIPLDLVVQYDNLAADQKVEMLVFKLTTRFNQFDLVVVTRPTYSIQNKNSDSLINHFDEFNSTFQPHNIPESFN